MSSIKKRENGQWRARYRDDAGKEHARHFARKIGAQWWLDEDDGRGGHGPVRRPKGR